MKQKIYKYNGYLLLLPVYYFLHNFNQLPYLIPFDAYHMLPFLKMLLGAVLLYLITYVVTKSHSRTAVITFLCLLFGWYFGAYHDILKKLLGKNQLTSYKIVVPLTVIVLAGWLIYLVRNGPALKKAIHYFTALMGLLVAMEIVIFGINTYRKLTHNNLIYPHFSVSNKYRHSSIPPAEKPDIYLLIFDEYTNNGVLKEFWNFDNSAITSWLKEGSFYVVDSGKSNYDFTPYSVAALLNMDYVDARKSTNGTNPLYMLQGIRSISNNQVFDILKKEGYAIRFFAPFQNEVEEYKGVKEFDEFPYIQLYHTTLLYRLKSDVLWNFPKWQKFFSRSPREEEARPSYGNTERRVRDIFTTVKNIKTCADSTVNRPPRLVYGHIMITHDPHLFDSAGNIKPPHQMVQGNQFFDTYIDQVKVANKTMMELVTYIKAYNKKNTIIIIMSDHGFRHLPPEKQKHYFSNFQAMYFPDSAYNQLYQTISPVNTFRTVFNNYFNQQYPLLNDSSIKVTYSLPD